MKTYIVTEAHKTEILFRGKRTEVKRFIKNHKKNYGTDPMEWDVAQVLSNGLATASRVWGEDFIESGFKNN
jgi:hypothetical protein